MDRLKTFGKYALLLIGFFILSNFLIFIGINSNYDEITPMADVLAQVEITRAEATLVNGRMSGIIKNSSDNDLNGKYIRINLFSEQGNILGTKFLQITDMAPDAQEEFNTYFEVKEVEHYTIEITNEVEQVEGSLLDVFTNEELTSYAIISALVLLIIL